MIANILFTSLRKLLYCFPIGSDASRTTPLTLNTVSAARWRYTYTWLLSIMFRRIQSRWFANFSCDDRVEDETQLQQVTLKHQWATERWAGTA